MKVRVKEGEKGFIYGVLRREGQEFDLIKLQCTGDKDKFIKPEEQFSSAWMEKVEVKAKPGPKPKPAEKQEEVEK